LPVGGVFEALSLREITKTISQASMLLTGFLAHFVILKKDCAVTGLSGPALSLTCRI